MAFTYSEARKILLGATKALFRPNFYRIHLLYFILVIVVGSGILYGSSTSSFPLAYIDAIYLCTSAMCNVGLATVNLGSLTGFQQSVLFVMMLMGDLSIVSISVVLVRRYYFSKRIRGFLCQSQASRQIAEDIEERREKERAGSSRRQGARQSAPSSGPGKISTGRWQSHLKGYGAYPSPWELLHRGVSRLSQRRQMAEFAQQHHYLSFEPTLDPKVAFVFLIVFRAHDARAGSHRLGPSRRTNWAAWSIVH